MTCRSHQGCAWTFRCGDRPHPTRYSAVALAQPGQPRRPHSPSPRSREFDAPLCGLAVGTPRYDDRRLGISLDQSVALVTRPDRASGRGRPPRAMRRLGPTARRKAGARGAWTAQVGRGGWHDGGPGSKRRQLCGGGAQITIRPMAGPSANFTHHFLIAMPAMADPNFANTLTFVCGTTRTARSGLSSTSQPT